MYNCQKDGNEINIIHKIYVFALVFFITLLNYNLFYDIITLQKGYTKVNEEISP